jgi:hypothetical protein
LSGVVHTERPNPPPPPPPPPPTLSGVVHTRRPNEPAETRTMQMISTGNIDPAVVAVFDHLCALVKQYIPAHL